MTSTTDKIAIIGAGSIGIAFALLFAQAEYQINLHDSDKQSLMSAKERLARQAKLLAEGGLLDTSVDDLLARVILHDDLAIAVKDVMFVQECVLEKLEIKKEIFQQLELHAPPHAVFASSSSALPSSAFCSDLDCAMRCLIGHPGNPPFLIPVIEIVPCSRTSQASVDLAREIYTRCALKPVVLNKEIIGPFETSDLDYRGGITDHAQRIGQAYAEMAAERSDTKAWPTELVAEVAKQRRHILSLDDWADRVAWRDRELLALRVLRRTREARPD